MEFEKNEKISKKQHIVRIIILISVQLYAFNELANTDFFNIQHDPEHGVVDTGFHVLLLPVCFWFLVKEIGALRKKGSNHAIKADEK